MREYNSGEGVKEQSPARHGRRSVAANLQTINHSVLFDSSHIAFLTFVNHLFWRFKPLVNTESADIRPLILVVACFRPI